MKKQAIHPTFIDLFSGAGLMSAGFVAAGFKPLLAIELDKFAVSSYNNNHSPVAQVGDVSVLPDGLKTDVVLAGPPCQGFSTLGRRDPKDKRNDLSLLVFNWVIKTNASVAIIENVPPYLQSPQYSILAERFRKAGFDVTATILQATDFGVAQRRERCFVVASRREGYSAPIGKQKPSTVSHAFEGLEHLKDDPMSVKTTLSGLAAQRIRHIPPGGDKRDLLRAAPELCPRSWFRMGCQATDVWGRMFWCAPANTLRCCFYNPSKGRYLHPDEDRVLTLREAARLQGVPDNWQFEGPRTVICRQIGNGVPVPLSNAIASQVRELFH